MSIGVSDIIASGSFYDAILESLGYARVFEDLRPGGRHQAIGYGVVPNEDIFVIKERSSENLSLGPGFHLAFSAPLRESIDIFEGCRNRSDVAIVFSNPDCQRVFLQHLNILECAIFQVAH